MNIYFSCSITGGRAEEENYQAMVAEMLALGHVVPTAHLSQSDVLELEKKSQPAEIFTRDMRWLQNCDVVVAEVTTPSHGVGYEIAIALSLAKPVLCCYQKGRKISMILTGNSSPYLMMAAYSSIEGAKAEIREFLSRCSMQARS
jgi:nucleoside 2-deoxyribosyltransferase